MYILSNALTSISRNKGRNLMIGAIVLVIASAVAVTLAINNAAENLINSYADKYETEATISFDRGNMMKDFDPADRDNSMEQMSNVFESANSLTIAEVETYADSEYVNEYYYTVSLGVDGSDIDPASMTATNNDNHGGFGMGGGGPAMEQDTSDFTLQGYSSIAAMTDFIDGNFSITEGEVSEDFDSNNCLINTELATLNDLAVGDSITLVDSNDTASTYTFIISGIYEEATEGAATTQGNGMSMFANSVNTIITNSNAVVNFAAQSDDTTISVSPTFVLTSSEVVEPFEAEIREKGLSESLTVETNLDQIQGATSTISNVQTFAVTFLIVALIIGTVVLFVLNLINIRERKYEIGVLRTIGMKKSLVSLQFMTELLIVSFVALLLGAGVGAAISVPISNNLLASEIANSQSSNQQISDRFGFGGGATGGQNPPDAGGGAVDGGNAGGDRNFKGVATIQAYDSIDAAVDLKVLAELLAIGLVITLISSIGATASIQKFSPLTILKERS